jgi:NAD(P)-dependent dehydrogenase (short-subunit alcohol dehydrogenase family)
MFSAGSAPRRARSHALENAIKTIVITGSTRGIGLGLAEEFLKRGCRVAVSSRSTKALADRLTVLGAQDSGHIYNMYGHGSNDQKVSGLHIIRRDAACSALFHRSADPGSRRHAGQSRMAESRHSRNRGPVPD